MDEVEFDWAGTDTFPAVEIVAFVHGPPVWTGGLDLDVHVESATHEFNQELVELLRSSEATEIYESIRLNDVLIFPAPDAPDAGAPPHT